MAAKKKAEAESQLSPRDEADKALSRAIKAWIRASRDGDPLSKAVTNILCAAQAAQRAGDLDALHAKPGPDRWASSYRRKGIADPSDAVPSETWLDRKTGGSRLEEARWLVRQLEWWTKRYRTAGKPLPWSPKTKPIADDMVDPTEDGVTDPPSHIAHWLALIMAMRSVKAELVPPPADGDLAAVKQRMIDELRKSCAREGANAGTLAQAVLRGWGLSQREAESAVQSA